MSTSLNAAATLADTPVLPSLEVQIAGVARKIEDLGGQITKIENEMAKVESTNPRFGALERRLEALQQEKSALQQEKTELTKQTTLRLAAEATATAVVEMPPGLFVRSLLVFFTLLFVCF